MVKKIFNKTTTDKNENTDKEGIRIDYVIMLALVNTMVLFSKTQLKNLVLLVFQMNNRWLNDIIVQNCRTLDTLDYYVENEFVRYFGRMDIKIFLRRFFDMQFSLSVSEKFRYVRKMHIITMLIDIICSIMMILIGVTVVVCFFNNGISQIDKVQIFFDVLNKKNSLDYILSLENILIFVAAIVMLFLISYVERFFRSQSLIVYCAVALSTVFLLNNKLLIIGCIEIVISIIVVITVMSLLYVHAIKFYISDRKLLKNVLKKSAKQLRKLGLNSVFLCSAFILVTLFHEFVMIIGLAICIVLFIITFYLAGYFVFHYLKDCMWLRKHSTEINHIQRKQLENNLESIYFSRIKHKYLELLLLQNIELTGMWSDDIRPQYRDDRVNHALAKLDCIKLDSCDYLF